MNSDVPCVFRQSDGWSVGRGVGAWPPPEEEAAQESNHVHGGAAGGAGEGFWENPLPWYLHQRGAGPEDQTHWGPGSGNDTLTPKFTTTLSFLKGGFTQIEDKKKTK